MSPSVSIPWLQTLRRRGGESIWILIAVTLLLVPMLAAARTAKRLVPVLLKPSATFDVNPLTSLKANPTVSGSATSTTPLDFVVVNKIGQKVYEDPSVLPIQNRFSETIYPPISNGTYKVFISSGATTLASSTLTIGLRTMPSVELSSGLPSFDVSDGHLMRFSIRTHGSGAGIDKLSFEVLPHSADVQDIYLYGYTDPDFTQPIVASSTDPLRLDSAQINATSSLVSITPDALIEIPANSTYYFDLVGTVSPLDTVYNVETKLLSDNSSHFDTADALASTSNFVWSPNTYGLSSVDMHDWTTGALITGIPRDSLVEVRTNPPPTNAPACVMGVSTTSAAAGTPVTFTWSSTGAASAQWDNGAKELVSGTKTYIQGTTTHTYILNFYGPYGFSNCYSTVAMPNTYVAATTTATTTLPADSFTAPATATVATAVTVTGSVNNTGVCAAQTYSFNFGEGATSTISVAKNLCKAQTFTLNHAYTKVGTFTLGLYSSTGTSSKQRIQTQTIMVKAKVVGFFGGGSNMASILSAFNDFWQWIKNTF